MKTISTESLQRLIKDMKEKDFYENCILEEVEKYLKDPDWFHRIYPPHEISEQQTPPIDKGSDGAISKLKEWVDRQVLTVEADIIFHGKKERLQSRLSAYKEVQQRFQTLSPQPPIENKDAEQASEFAKLCWPLIYDNYKINQEKPSINFEVNEYALELYNKAKVLMANAKSKPPIENKEVEQDWQAKFEAVELLADENKFLKEELKRVTELLNKVI